MKNKPLSTFWLVAFIAGAIGVAQAKPTRVEVDDLKPSREHKQSALIITKVIDRFHYRKVDLDDAMSTKIFERYLDSLDPNKSFFTERDLQAFEPYRVQLDDALRRAQLEPAFAIFKRFRALVEQRAAMAVALLETNDFDFDLPEVYEFDREDVPWMADEKALDDMWRRRVKNDILALQVAGKKPADVNKTLKKRYQGIARRVQQFTAEDVFQAFINAYTLSIEPHTSYMSPRSSENFDISMRLSLQGIGAVLRNENEYTLVQSTVPGGPAERSGELRSGDRILGVGQGKEGISEDVVGWRLQDVVDLIRGPKGSIVRLNILPKSVGADGPTREIVLVRDQIRLEDQAAKSEILEGLPGMNGARIGVIEVPAFYRDFKAQSSGVKDFRSTTRDVRQLLADLMRQGVDGVVIDLRRNGGGSLSEATELTGLFIDQGPIVQVRDANGRVDIERDPDPELIYEGPLAVLVDRNSASASEIFAGAIQDYRRGIVVGEPTFGKGTVQTLVDLGRFVRGDDDLGRLRLTMAQFFRINGGSTQHRGVTPDVTFPTALQIADQGERSLDNALPWTSIDAVDYKLQDSVSMAALRRNHAERINQDPGFRYLIDEEADIVQLRALKTVSLNADERKREWQVREQRRLERHNRLRAFRGLEPLAGLEESEDEAEADDETDGDQEQVSRIMLEEAARILADYIQLRRPLTAQIDAK
jgi:carboxyl-terminal processing protease